MRKCGGYYRSTPPFVTGPRTTRRDITHPPLPEVPPQVATPESLQTPDEKSPFELVHEMTPPVLVSQLPPETDMFTFPFEHFRPIDAARVASVELSQKRVDIESAYSVQRVMGFSYTL